MRRAALTGVLAIGVFVAMLGGPIAAYGAAGLSGTVTAGGKPLANAKVTLFAASSQTTSQLAQATTDGSGAFTMPSYTAPKAGALYVDATPPNDAKLRLRAVVGVVGTNGGVSMPPSPTVTVNELTTVAAAYALAQFTTGDAVSGASPGLENAAATSFNLADAETGKAGSVVNDQDNGTRNDTLATLDTLANLVSRCAPPQSAACDQLLRLATPPGGTAPADTVAAMVDLARNPTLALASLYALAHGVNVYQPALTKPVTAWGLVLLYTAPELYASGRIAIDAKGNVWSSVNWITGTKNPSPYVVVLNPVGQPTLGSPIKGGGMKTGGWTTAITPTQGNVWVSAFAGGDIAEYSGTGQVLSPSTGFTNGSPNHPQGIAVDQKGNIWIANNYGTETAPGLGNVIVYPGGDPSKAITITGGGINHPFAVQIDGYGRAWVSNAGLGGSEFVGTKAAPLIGKAGGSITVIGTNFKPTSFSPIENGSFVWPLGIGIDANNNAWVADAFSSKVTQLRPDGSVAGVYELPHLTTPWGVAVDGSDRVWVSGFGFGLHGGGLHGVWLLCGENTSACPPGSATGAILSPKLGFQSKAFQHFTSIQIDQAGNIWLSNNNNGLKPVVGGTGIAEIIGAATPVCAPLQPLPQKPSATAETACPMQTAAVLPASLAGVETSSGSSAWKWIAIAAVILAVVFAGVVLVRRRRRVQERV